MYNIVVIGGTFDHLHEGHKEFLRFAFQNSRNVLIGLTSDTYAGTIKQYASHLQAFFEREKAPKRFLEGEGVLSRVAIAQIDSVFYPKEWENLPIDAVIVTKDTFKGAQRINEDRKRKEFSPLDIVMVPMFELQQAMTSSTATRKRLS